jgi:hypothetical protein
MKARCTALFLVFLPAAALVIAAGCTHGSSPGGSPRTTATVAAAATFVGSDACADCHPKEFKSHGVTGHALSMRTIGSRSSMGATPPLGPIPNSRLELQMLDYHYAITHRDSGNFFPLHFAVGSGKQGTTYIAIPSEKSLFEMRWSYFPVLGKWLVTPGQEKFKGDTKGLGITLTGGTPRSCILCHSVTLPADSLFPEPKFLGVGCESCHGPGSVHASSGNKRGGKVVHMEDLSRIGGIRMNALCGKCHRDTDEVMKLSENQRVTQRFFPYGLWKSKCFQASKDKMTCSTCHDPHTSVSSDRSAYEARCLSCHNTSAATHGAPIQKSCPVNPRSGCIGCHMPRRNAFPSTTLPIRMADHWIRSYKGKM